MASVTLRQYRESDFEPFYEMNSDPEVMRYFPATLSRQEALEVFQMVRGKIENDGWGVWAVDVNGAFAGFTGLMVPRFAASFMPCTEILWRFRREYWGRGVAYSAAIQALAYGFSTLRLNEIVAFTSISNLRSIHLMDRLGFVRDFNGDFNHPSIPSGHPLRHHVLYRKMPNQLPDPTSPSVTPPAGAGGAPSVAADH